MLNPVIAMLHNTKLNRWHPIFFAEKPLPGPPGSDKPIRHKSASHHTEGFETREAALSAIENDLKDRIGSYAGVAPEVCLEGDFPWDGEGTPAMVVYFVRTEGKLSPALVG